MATIGSLTVNIVAKTGGLVRGLSRSRSLVRGFALATGLSATAVVAGVAKMVASYERLNQSMNRSLAIMGDVSDTMRNKMTAAAIDISTTTQFAAHEVADAYFFLASAGLRAEQTLAALPIVARFAQAGNFDLATATSLAADAQSALGMKSEDTIEYLGQLTRVTDVLVKANVLANATTQQFSEALTNKAGAALKVLGKSMEEGVAVLAAFAEQGVKGAEAGTALTIVLRDLQTKAIDNKAAFAAAGVAVFDAAGKMQNLADIVHDAEILLAGLSDEQSKATLLMLGFSDKSIAYVQSLLGMSEAIRQYEKALYDAGGTSREVAEKSLTDLQKSVNSLRGSWERLSMAIGNTAEKMGLFLGLAEGMGGFAILLEQATKTGEAAGKKRDIIESLTASTGSGLFGLEAGGPGPLTRMFSALFKPFMPTEKLPTASEQAMLDKYAANTKERRRVAPARAALEVAGAVSPLVSNVQMGLEAVGGVEKLLDKTNGMLATIESQERVSKIEAIKTQEELEKRTLQEQKTLEQSMVRRAEQLRDMMKTPAERLMESIDEARQLVKRGLLDQTSLDRLIAQQTSEQARQTSEQARKADSIRQSIQTEAERAQETLAEALDLFGKGLLGEGDVSRLIKQWDDKLQVPGRNLGVIERGSREAFDFGRGKSENQQPINRVAKAAEEQLAVMKAVKDLLDPTKTREPPYVGDINVTTTNIA